MLDTLIRNFSVENLNTFLRNRINNYTTEKEELDYLFTDELYDKYESVIKLGAAKIGNDDFIVIASKTNEALTEKTGKKNQYEIAKKVLKEEVADASLFVFYDDEGHFRFSFVKAEYIGKKREFTEFKRYTYFVSPTLTNKTFIHQIGNCDFSSLDKIIEAFSVEPLNKQFYQEINKAFYSLIGGSIGKGKKKQTLDAVLQLPNTNDKIVVKEFAVRLIGRTIFCWFLKNKKSENGIPLVPENWLSSSAVKANENYYHSRLEKLFFLSLNKKREDRGKFNLPQGHETVPFLNGGLFEPHREDYFNNQANTDLNIPDAWFANLFQVLEQFNFTIDENSTSDAEVSIDPEMLGTIFENLLAEIDPDTEKSARKSTGSFYTPREIVDYMVEQSLVQYLKTKTEISNEEQLLQLFKESGQEHTFTDKETTKILDALSTVTILDPACGSGAFPMGAVQKIVLALKQLDPDAEQWKAIQLNKYHGNSTSKKKLEEKLSNATSDYARKLGVIQNAIYGVDIQSIATDISKLRSFLSLVIDENIDDTAENRGIEPLPNLEFKFVTANTLIALPQTDQKNMFTDYDAVDTLASLRNEYFQSSGKKKDEIKERFIKLQKDALVKGSNLFADHESREYKIISWNPFGNNSSSWFDPQWMFGIEKFDVVIGNPPYVQLQSNGGTLANMYQNSGYKTFKRTGDIYCLFYENGTNLLKEHGTLCYITSNKWMRAGYGEATRAFFAKHNPIKLLDFAGFKVFESATVDTNILLLEKTENQKNTLALHFKPDYKKGDSITQYVQENAIQTSFTDAETWAILSLIEQSIKQKIERIGKPLKDWDINIYRGVLTGYNEAFIISGEQRKTLIEQDPKSAEIIKPILRGRDIKKYSYQFADLWLIATFPAKNYNIDDFPAVKTYLEGFSPKLEQTGVNLTDDEKEQIIQHAKYYGIEIKGSSLKKSRKKTGNKWFETQDQIAYFEEFEKEKIVWGNINYNNQFCYENDRIIINAPANLLTSNTISLKLLIGLMNSKMFYYSFSKTGIDLGHAFEWKKQYVEQIPLPKIQDTSNFDEIVTQIIEKKSNNEDTQDLEKQIDHMVYKLYELSEEEIAFIEDKIG